MDAADRLGKIIRLLEEALVLADDLEDGPTGYLIERALDEARSRQFRLGISSSGEKRPTTGSTVSTVSTVSAA